MSLRDEVRRRLPAGATMREEQAGLVVMLPELHLAAHVGLQDLEPFTPECPGQPFRERVPELPPVLYEPGSPAWAEHYIATLMPQTHMLQLNPDVTVPAPMRFTRSTHWKGVRPSRRRHMKSWRYASDAEKLRYAPMYRQGRYPYGRDWWRWPWWAQHPDRGRTVCLGKIVVRQPITVYTLNGADVSQQLATLSRTWCHRVTAALGRGEKDVSFLDCCVR